MRRRIAAILLATISLAVFGAVSASAAPANQERFLVVQTSIDQPGTLLATGPVSGGGKDVVVSDTRDRFEMQRGNLYIIHSPTGGDERFNPTTCVFTFTEQGTYQVAGGTGVFAGATGSGIYRARGTVQGCDQNQPPNTFSVVIEAIGPLNLNSPA